MIKSDQSLPPENDWIMVNNVLIDVFIHCQETLEWRIKRACQYEDIYRRNFRQKHTFALNRACKKNIMLNVCFLFNCLNPHETILHSLSHDTLISRTEELFTNVCLLLRLWKLSVVKAPCFALPPFFSFLLMLCKSPYFSGLAWLSYKLLFVRHDPSSITIGGKPSHGRSCHLEADQFSWATDGALPPFSPPSWRVSIPRSAFLSR